MNTRSLITLLVMVMLSLSGISQDLKITIGRGTNCFGRGACSINLSSFDERNAVLLVNNERAMVIRVFRDRLNSEEEDNLLEAPLYNSNKKSLRFILTTKLDLPNELRLIINSRNPDSQYSNFLPAMTYETLITEEHIDIQLK